MPYTGDGVIFAHTGVAYVGMNYWNNNANNYFEVKLKDSLVTNKSYYVEFFATPGKVFTKLACNNVALLLTKKAIYADTANGIKIIPANPQIVGYSNPIINDTTQWTKISGVYKAEGGELYITLGNFKYVNQTNYIINNPNGTYFGVPYVIDDVSVIPLDSFCLKADAGKDTTITIGDSIFIGSYTNGIDSLKWLQNGVVIDSTRPGFWVKPTTGTSYILQQTVNGCFSSDTVTIGVLVPLKFVSFILRQAQVDKVENVWTTANEINVSHFNIQRSVNGKDFETIGKVKAENKSYNEYSFIDDLKTKDQKTLYYRIESIDNDGKKHYSEVKKISNNHFNYSISVFPNPTKGLVHISIPREEKGIWSIKIQDVVGRVLQTKTTSAITKTMDMVVSNKAGVYYITLENKTTNKKIVEKIVVE